MRKSLKAAVPVVVNLDKNYSWLSVHAQSQDSIPLIPAQMPLCLITVFSRLTNWTLAHLSILSISLHSAAGLCFLGHSVGRGAWSLFSRYGWSLHECRNLAFLEVLVLCALRAVHLSKPICFSRAPVPWWKSCFPRVYVCVPITLSVRREPLQILSQLDKALVMSVCVKVVCTDCVLGDICVFLFVFFSVLHMIDLNTAGFFF